MKANRFFYKIDNQGNPIPGTLARLNKKPKQGQWVEVSSDICCPEEPCPECPEICTSETYLSENPVGEVVGAGNIFSVTINYNGVAIINENWGEGVPIDDILNTLNGNLATFEMVFSLTEEDHIQLDVTNSDIACQLEFIVIEILND